MIRVKSRQKTEYGDFQTPMPLAEAVCRMLRADGVRPDCVLEPTCGQGTFLAAAANIFSDCKRLVGREWNRAYVAETRRRLSGTHCQVDLAQADFFQQDWSSLLKRQPGHLLVLGNPPWVTNSALGTLGSGNLPAKSNFQHERGLSAKTGKANFDISQWMILRLLETMPQQDCTLAMLCKTTVARKVLEQAWKSGLPIADSRIYKIDSREHFDASVDACLLVCQMQAAAPTTTCDVYEQLDADLISSVLGMHSGNLVADHRALARQKHLLDTQPTTRWRSGVKHDCRAVMQLERQGWCLVNGLGERVELEPDYLYPMMPAGAVYRGEVKQTDKFLIVPQKRTGEDTAPIESAAPRTWAYLQRHATRLADRKSSIYRGRPPFSIFGIGEYSFAKWKVAISALHKQLSFRVIPPQDGRPVMLDDTTYFLSFRTKKDAVATANRLNSPEVQEFYRAWIFWDAKRPITSEILQRLKAVD
ncbi:SAM-dependent methyltransferase [Blastopirellula marina]|uniref:SAM-dependent methyltransferase n=1 Tax=Blastopirellula marina TaxID=124 RepID=A0A2S8FU27_9BACT|nr:MULTISPECIES: N-6 DNA methylase [Pirellulaceae]PQO35688.1 SAM-dependent methyltransferase [Blastopirellula marina]RCS53262.1 SAM-dependent methyltransferase [Bremerella cremea]